jgi:hypothetical protein
MESVGSAYVRKFASVFITTNQSKRRQSQMSTQTKSPQKPNGSAEQYIVVGNRPGMQFMCEKLSPAWLRLKEEEKAGTLHQRYPHLRNVKVGHVMTPDMFQDMTLKFDSFGEFHTPDEEIAILAFDSIRHIDPNARLHSTSLPIDSSKLKELGPGSVCYAADLARREREAKAANHCTHCHSQS